MGFDSPVDRDGPWISPRWRHTSSSIFPLGYFPQALDNVHTLRRPAVPICIVPTLFRAGRISPTPCSLRRPVLPNPSPSSHGLSLDIYASHSCDLSYHCIRKRTLWRPTSCDTSLRKHRFAPFHALVHGLLRALRTLPRSSLTSSAARFDPDPASLTPLRD